jgi:methylthioribose-1-phosphate isomerase
MTVTRPRHRGPVVALRFEENCLRAIDQTLLPWREVELELHGAAEVAGAIRRLAIRGAPLIGVAAAYGVALELAGAESTPDHQRSLLAEACARLRDSRPTAVNLAWAVDRVRAAVLDAPPGDEAEAALAEAKAIHAEEEQASAALAAHGAALLGDCRRVLTHCNTGALAAPGRGTALAVIAELAVRTGLDKVLACETRPLLQGARLTVYELARLGIPHELVVDAAGPGLIASGAVDAVIVGCDRVAANGDVANKVGTYGLALAANAAGIPFVVAGPTSSIDPRCATGSEIAIEERDAEEVRTAGSAAVAPRDTPCRNPAFDVTPAALITAFVCERGVARPLGADSIRDLLAG